MTVLRSGSASDVGRVRSINQDMALEEPNLFAVADGMGGHQGGEVAARVAIEALRSSFARDASLDGLHQAFSAANAAIWRQSRDQSDLRGMGTTLTALALAAGPDGRDVLALANVGDSRAYLYSGGQLTQVTADHSLAEEKVRHGELTEAEAAVHPHRHILTRALGVATDVEIDLWELHLRSGDRLLLCSDGLTNEVGPEELTRVLGSVKDPKQAARRLVLTANEHGGHDNITVLVVDVLVGDQQAAAVIAPIAAGVPVLGDAAAEPGDGADPSGGDPSVTVPADSAAGSGSREPSDPSGAPAGEVPAGTVTAGIAARGRPDGNGSDMTGVVPVVGPVDPPTAAAASTGTSGTDTLVVTRRQWEPPPPETEEERRARLRRERRGRRRRLGIPRRVTLRVVVFILLVVAVVVAGYAVVRWYATQNWYVTIDGNTLVVYQGRPGGVLGFEPQLVDRSDVTTSQVLPLRLPALRADVDEPSLAKARAYITNLAQEEYDQQLLNLPPTTVAPPPSTTAPKPPVSTTTPGVAAGPVTAPTGRIPVARLTATEWNRPHPTTGDGSR